MRFFVFLFLALTALSASVSAPAHATTDWRKHWAWRWMVPEPRGDFRPYMGHPLHNHDRVAGWQGQDAIALPGPRAGLAAVQRFYNSDILRDQDTKHGVPALVVGPSFYHLSAKDQDWVVRLVDTVYGATNGPYKTIYLTDWHSDKIIGIYTRNGLQRH